MFLGQQILELDQEQMMMQETSGGNKASAEIDGLTSLYAIKTFDNGLFLKARNDSN